MRSLLWTVILSLFLSGLCASACYVAAHVSLGLFLGPLIFATILTPPLALSRDKMIEQGPAVAGIAFGISAVWAVATIRSDVTFLQWLQCTLVLAALLIALWGIAALIVRMTRSAVYAAAITVIIGLLWMTWPVWLSSRLSDVSNEGRLIAWLVPMHPPLVLSTLLDMGVWGEQRVAYHLTTLGQDIIYRPPTQSWTAIIVHFIVGALALAVAKLEHKKSPRRRKGAKESDRTVLSTS